jgi:hypothetical protein
MIFGPAGRACTGRDGRCVSKVNGHKLTTCVAYGVAVGESAADAARSIVTQLSALEAQAAGQAEEYKELLAMKQVCPQLSLLHCLG